MSLKTVLWSYFLEIMNYLLVSFFGAAVQEVLHFIDLKQELGRNIRIVKSIDYWVIALTAIIIFTLATPIIVDGFESNDENFGMADDWHYVLVSFTFPSIVRKLVKVFIKRLMPRTPTVQYLNSHSNFQIENYLKLF